MLNHPLFYYGLHLGDNALILSHRNSEWTGHGPVLEQDIALTNIALDLIGQARNFYQYAAKTENRGSTEDHLAYFRDARDFRNCLITEQPNGDWSKTIVRQFFFSTYQYLLYNQLQNSSDSTIAAIAEKALKEVTYHLRWSSEWVIRLGDGTEESHHRITQSLHDLWEFTGELTAPAGFEKELASTGIAVDTSQLKDAWNEKVNEVLSEATLIMPSPGAWMQTGGKEGLHTEHLGYILAEMQFLQRAYPGCEW